MNRGNRNTKSAKNREADQARFEKGVEKCSIANIAVLLVTSGYDRICIYRDVGENHAMHPSVRLRHAFNVEEVLTEVTAGKAFTQAASWAGNVMNYKLILRKKKWKGTTLKDSWQKRKKKAI